MLKIGEKYLSKDVVSVLFSLQNKNEYHKIIDIENDIIYIDINSNTIMMSTNNTIFSNYSYFFDYYYTKQEERKLKLLRLIKF